MRKPYATIVVGAVVGALALTGCSSNSSSDAPVPTPTTTSAAPSAASSPSAAPSSLAAGAASATPTAGGTAASGKPVAVNQTIDDPEMGDHVVAESLVRNFPTPPSMSAVSDREIVLVKMNVKAGSKYYAGWQSGSLQIVTPDGDTNSSSTAPGLTDAMTAAGYPPFPNGGNVDTGKTGSGWAGFVVQQKNSPTLTLRMKRLAATTSGGQTIPAKNFDVPLTT